MPLLFNILISDLKNRWVNRFVDDMKGSKVEDHLRRIEKEFHNVKWVIKWQLEFSIDLKVEEYIKQIMAKNCNYLVKKKKKHFR